MIDTQSPTAENSQGKKKKEEENRATAAKYNGLPYWSAIINRHCKSK